MSEASRVDTVSLVKGKLTILEVVQPYVKLTKAGRYYRGLSPFGKEKTPSFYVNPERGTYYCFSTSQGGDHFTFIEKMEGVDFKGALKILAEKAGVPLEFTAGADRSKDTERLERLRSMMREAEAFFTAGLTEGSAALTYAKSRGLTDASIKEWGLGFAPDAWRGLLDSLGGKGYSPKDLTLAGLVKEADEKAGTWYDRFRNRLMFPIRDAAGRTVAFTGRALAADDSAKYLNSPETDLYKKSEILFGMDRAKDAIRTRGFAILVEGQFDLVLLHQAGFQNTVALSGTALSDQHLSLIKRYADNLMLCLDADRAGLASSAKSAQAALRAGMRVKAVRMPQGKDPADIVSGGGKEGKGPEEGAKEFAKLVKEAQTIVEFFLSVLGQNGSDDLALLRAVEETVLPLVAVTKSPLEQQRLIDIIARSISSTSEAVRAAMPRPEPAQQQVQNGGQYQNQRQGQSYGNRPAYDAQNGGAQSGAQGGRPQGNSLSAAPASNIKARRDLILAAIASYPETPLAERLISEYSRIIGAPPPSDEVDERLLFEAGLVFGETPSAEAGDDILRMFERSVLTEGLQSATIALRKAEATQDEAGIRDAAETCRELSAKLATLN